MFLQKHVGKAVRRIVKDFKQKELIPLKILFFVQATTIAVLYPYLTVHMRDLGISIEETAIMSAMVPVIGILMPPLAGMVADKVGNFKVLLSLSSLIGGLTALLLLAVPAGVLRSEYPDRLLFDIGCATEYGRTVVRLGDENHCERISPRNASQSLNARLETCGLACETDVHQPPGLTIAEENHAADLILNASGYSVKIETGNETRSMMFNLTGDGREISGTVTRLPGNFYFFPTRGTHRLRCVDPSRFTEYLATPGAERKISDGRFCFINDGIEGELSPSSVRHEPPGGSNWEGSITLRYGEDDTEVASDFGNSACVDPHVTRKETVTVSVYLSGKGGNDLIELSKCESRCLATADRKDACTNMEKEVPLDPGLTFWSYFVVRVLIGITGSTSYSMFEVAVIAILREQKADYGLQRIYATIGGMVASPLSGFLIDYASKGRLGTDFSPAFYLYAALKILSSLLLLLINLEFKKAAKNVISDFFHILKNAEVLSLLASCFVLGAAWGYIESFLFWFLEDLGGNRSLMGITVTIGGLAGIPLLILSGPIIDKIGHANVIFIGFIFYAIRLLGYSLIYNPYHCLYFEAMESITSSLAITAAITYAAKLSTTTTDGSLQGLVGGLYYGVGKGAGTLVGGYLMKSYGTRETYQIFAVFTISIGIIYFLINQLYIKKLPNRSNNAICEKAKKPEKPVIGGQEVKVITEKTKKEAVETQEEHKNDGYVDTETENQRKEPEDEEAERRKEQTNDE